MTDTNEQVVAEAVADVQARQIAERRAQLLEAANRGLTERIDRLNISYAESQRQLEQVRREFEQFKEAITERMQREADRRNWCGEFDDIMEEFGLRRRSRNWDVTFEVTGHINMTLIARDADHAERIAWGALQVSTDNTYQVGRHGQHTLRISDVSCDEVEESET